MTLAEFMNSKPHELRLGQYFYICYFFALKPVDKIPDKMDWLYNTDNYEGVELYINQIMLSYSWRELPPMLRYNG